jgi:hypothetical protein
MENLFYTSKKLILIGSVFLFFSCSQDELLNNDSLKATSQSLTAKISPDKVIVFKGPKVAFGQDSVRSWVSMNKATGLPVEIGIEMTPGALTGLTDNGDGSTHVIPLHLKARQLTPFNHIGLNWRNHGHAGGPPGTFTSEHFDFHFYMISNEERQAIPAWSPSTTAAFNNWPPDGYLPSDYGTGPGAAGAEPQMGKHWSPIDLSPYLPFSKIMIYGSFNGKVIFVEPMVKLDYLLSNVDSKENAYSQPLHFAKAGYYPTKYNVYHDTKTGNTNITLSNFVAREATTN